jgi:hypothetical protein
MSFDHSSKRASTAPGRAHSSPTHSRTDFRTRDVVNQAIAAMPTLGVQQCAEYLSSMKVPPEVAIRALSQRRSRG